MQALIGLLRTMRPHQWTKNIFVFAGIVFDGQLFVMDALLRVILTFILFCLISSTVYIINDIADRESDRQHPKKSKRPIPSGKLPLQVAIIAVIILPIVTIGIALSFSTACALILLAYFVINLFYTFYLKHQVILDVMTVASGFVLRVAAGTVVIEVARFSPWLYALMGLLALFLAVGKRRQELVLMKDKAHQTRTALNQYNQPLLDNMLTIVVASIIISYLLYTIEEPSELLHDTHYALLTVPFVFYAMFRYLYLIYVKEEGGAPDEVFLKDRPLQLTMLLWAVSFIFILYVLIPSFIQP